MTGELEALELSLAAIEQADHTAATAVRVACPVAGAAARALSALPLPADPAAACYRAIELAALSLLADDPDPVRIRSPLPGCDDWLEDVVSCCAMMLLALAAREEHAQAKAIHDRLLETQPERERLWLALRSPSLEARRRAFSLFAAYRLTSAISRLVAGDWDAAAGMSDQARSAADMGIDVRLSVACTWVGSVARAAIPPASPVLPLAS